MDQESNSQNPDQALEHLIMSETITTTSSSEAIISHQSQSSPQATRSYECTFCKRGFTNAQALGGHMNIHRKDKAKLKQQPFTIHHQTKPPLPPTLQRQQSSEITNCDHNPSYSSLNHQPMMSDKLNVGHSDDQDHGVKWPNLFLDDQDKEEKHDVDHERASSELDLELRLGPEPPQDSSAATRTFF